METAITTRWSWCGRILITHAEINGLIITNELKVGCWYEIVDYTTTAPIVWSNIEFATWPTEVILVMATSTNTLAHNGYSETYGDRISIASDVQQFMWSLSIEAYDWVIDNPAFTDLGGGTFSLDFPWSEIINSYVAYYNDDYELDPWLLVDLGSGTYGIAELQYLYNYGEEWIVYEGDFIVTGNTIEVVWYDLNTTSTPLNNFNMNIGSYNFNESNYGTDWEFVDGNIVVLTSIDVEDIFDNEYLDIEFNYSDNVVLPLDFDEFNWLYFDIQYIHNTTVQTRITSRHRDDRNFNVMEDYHAVLHRRWKLDAPVWTAWTYTIGDFVKSGSNIFISVVDSNSTWPWFNDSWMWVAYDSYDHTTSYSVFIDGSSYSIYINADDYEDYLMFDSIDVIDTINTNPDAFKDTDVQWDFVVRSSITHSTLGNSVNRWLTIYNAINSQIQNASGVIANSISTKIANSFSMSMGNANCKEISACQNLIINNATGCKYFIGCSTFAARNWIRWSALWCNSFTTVRGASDTDLTNGNSSVVRWNMQRNIIALMSGCRLTDVTDNTFIRNITNLLNCRLTGNEIVGSISNSENFWYDRNQIAWLVQDQRSSTSGSVMRGCKILTTNWFRGTATTALNIVYEFDNIRSHSFRDYTTFTVNPTSFVINNVTNLRGVLFTTVNSTGLVQFRDNNIQSMTQNTLWTGGANLNINFLTSTADINSTTFEWNAANLTLNSWVQNCIIEAGVNNVVLESTLVSKTITTAMTDSTVKKTTGANFVVIKYDNTGALVTTTF